MFGFHRPPGFGRPRSKTVQLPVPPPANDGWWHVPATRPPGPPAVATQPSTGSGDAGVNPDVHGRPDR